MTKDVAADVVVVVVGQTTKDPINQVFGSTSFFIEEDFQEINSFPLEMLMLLRGGWAVASFQVLRFRNAKESFLT